jgi:peptide deformylase
MRIRIVTVPAKVLTQKSKLVTDFGPKLKHLIADMVDTLEACVDPVGVGLAAPQIGVALRIFICRPDSKSKSRVFINPEILQIQPFIKTTGQTAKKKLGESKDEALEGCLSIPRIWSPVTRPQQIKITWQDERGKHHQKDFEGFEAVIIQHEIDHLNGILFTERSTQQSAPMYEEKAGRLNKIQV